MKEKNMWARTVEIMLGVWLAISPYIFVVPSHVLLVRSLHLLVAAAICTVAFMSFSRRWWLLHFINFFIGALLISVTYVWSFYSGIDDQMPWYPLSQNWIVTGLLLSMFGIIPDSCDEPPKEWEEFGLQH